MAKGLSQYTGYGRNLYIDTLNLDRGHCLNECLMSFEIIQRFDQGMIDENLETTFR